MQYSKSTELQLNFAHGPWETYEGLIATAAPSIASLTMIERDNGARRRWHRTIAGNDARAARNGVVILLERPEDSLRARGDAWHLPKGVSDTDRPACLASHGRHEGHRAISITSDASTNGRAAAERNQSANIAKSRATAATDRVEQKSLAEIGISRPTARYSAAGAP